MHANAILRDRKRVSTKIELDWFAVPPTNVITELQQLSAWNKWIRYEMTNPDNLNTDQHNTMMKLVFEQCLCCMLHHPEIWMTYARFQQQLGGVLEILVFLYSFMGRLFWLFIVGLFCYICIFYYLYVDSLTYTFGWSAFLCRIRFVTPSL
jgi:hypothetical protein